jgi:YVTN family beta-propeller protein
MKKSEKSFLIYSVLIIHFLFLIIITSMVSVVTAQSNSPAPQSAYITNFKNETGPVIDTATNTVTSKVRVGQYPITYGQFMATHPHSPDQTLININSHDSEALDRNGVALVALNKHNEALKAFDKALEINPQDSIALKGKSALSNIGSKFDTMTELTSLTNKSTFGQLITFTAKIGTPSQGIKKPSGIVIFIDGDTQIGTETVNSAQAILTTSLLSVGSHSITAKYIGDNNFKPSTSSILTLMILNQSDLELQPIRIENPMLDTMTAVTSSANEYTSGQPITFTAKIDTMSQRAEKPLGTVTFIDGNTQIGTETVNSGQAILTTSSLSVGSHSITDQYIGISNFKPSASSPFTLTVKDESMFKHPLFPVVCGIVATVIGGFIRSRIQKKY